MNRVEKPENPLNTVEEFHDDIMEYIDNVKSGGLYILDSLDALSDAAELKEPIDKGSYGMGKAKKMSQMFRRIIRKLEQSNCHLMVISQTDPRLSTISAAAAASAVRFY